MPIFACWPPRPLQDICAALNSLCLCLFMPNGGGLGTGDVVSMLQAVTGWNWDERDLLRAGTCIYTLQRLINVRDGQGTIHARLFGQLRPGAEVPASLEVELPAGSTVADLCARLRIVPEKVAIVLVNRSQAQLGRVLMDGEEIMLVPPIPGG
ncbi:MAG: aldehyde ferredoxin oxidoreductase C-terminal domain-containing protein [Bacillota bacterium]